MPTKRAPQPKRPRYRVFKPTLKSFPCSYVVDGKTGAWVARCDSKAFAHKVCRALNQQSSGRK